MQSLPANRNTSMYHIVCEVNHAKLYLMQKTKEKRLTHELHIDTYQVFYQNRVATRASYLMELDVASIVFILLTCLLHYINNTCQTSAKVSCTRWRLVFQGWNTILLGLFHDSTRSIHCSLLVDLIGEVFETKCSGKGSKWSFFSLCRCWRTAHFIISMQPFLTIASFGSISNFA